MEIFKQIMQYISQKDIPLVFETFEMDFRKRSFLEMIVKDCIVLHKKICYYRDSSYIILIFYNNYKRSSDINYKRSI